MEADGATGDHVGADGVPEGEGEEGDEEDLGVGELLFGMAEREQVVEREEAEAGEDERDAAGDGEGRRVADRAQDLREREGLSKPEHDREGDVGDEQSEGPGEDPSERRGRVGRSRVGGCWLLRLQRSQALLGRRIGR